MAHWVARRHYLMKMYDNLEEGSLLMLYELD